MKNRYIVSLLLVSSIALYAMENNHTNVSAELEFPDWQRMHSVLQDKCQEKFKNRLKEYKKNSYPSVSSDWNMEDLVRDGKAITKQDDLTLKAVICATRDEEGNGFLHYAAEKNDEPTTEWHLELKNDNCNVVCVPNKQGQTPFEMCITKLLPEIDAEKKVIARKIFDKMLTYIAHCITCFDQKSSCLSHIINLQLKYVCAGIEFVVEENLLQKLVPTNSSLSHYYQQAHDERGFTFTHAWIENSDKLSELLKKNYVSFEKKDKDGLTALDYASKKLAIYMEDADQITSDQEGFERASCCMHLLLNYAEKCASNNDEKDFY